MVVIEFLLEVDMFIKLNSGVVINTNYITAIEPYDKKCVNSKGNEIKYLLYMVDGQQWYMTEEDYYRISQRV